MADWSLVPVVFFLPLFPFSMGFNLLFSWADRAWQRGLLVLLWPQLGLGLLALMPVPVPDWVMAWAVLTSALYAFRALALRDVGLWIGFLASSAWSLLWLAADNVDAGLTLHVHALAFSAPLLLLVLLADALERRVGAAYTGLLGGLAQSLPRFSVVLIFAVLAATATPLFPTFFTMLAIIVGRIGEAPVQAVALTVVWLLWSWGAIRLLQGLLVGPGEATSPDLSLRTTSVYVGALCGLVVAGLYMAGGVV